MADVVYRIEVTGLGGKSDSTSDEKKKNIEKPEQISSFNTKGVSNVISGKISALNGAIAVGAYVTNQAVNSYVRTIGLRTGNEYQQQQVEFGLGLAKTLFGSIIGGAVVGGVAGALGGLIMGSVSIGTQAIVSEYQAGIKRDWNIAGAMETQRVMNYASYGNNRTGGVLY